MGFYSAFKGLNTTGCRNTHFQIQRLSWSWSVSTRQSQ